MTSRDIISDLVDEGLAEVYWENGEEKVKFDFPQLEISHPSLAEEVKKIGLAELDETLVDLFKKGLLDMDYRINPDGSMDTIWSITDLGASVIQMLKDVG